MGRHGGINILHQKSWHVWRMDNRLRVERDELQFAQSERERLAKEHQAAFAGKVELLRRRALGVEEPVALVETSGPTASASSSSRPPSLVPPPLSAAAHPEETRGDAGKIGEADDAKWRAPRAKDSDNSFKHGAVTLSNLKQAERDMEQRLKRKRTGHGREEKQAGQRYWSNGTEGLGSGPHINLFEEAELAVDNQNVQLTKQLQYAERNNELVEKSKRRPLSEFDEIAESVPWYARPPEDGRGEGAAGQEASAASPSAGRKWGRCHGQAVLRVKATPEKLPPPCASVEAGGEGRPMLEDEPQWGLAECHVLSDSSCESSSRSYRKQAKKEKKEKKKKNKHKEKKKRKHEKERMEERADRRRRELAELRLQREARERDERARACGVLRLGPAA